jgi:hypothetical protein
MVNPAQGFERGRRVSIAAKPFQIATIDAAYRTLTRRRGTRRFLVADEVGLGKTIVASGVIKKLSDKKVAGGDGPLSVLYVCSNLAIAKQNIVRLLSFLPEAERKYAVATVDRPSLLSTRPRPEHKRVHIYMLTPDTAIATRKGQRRDGRLEERALALVLLHRIVAYPLNKLEAAFQRQAGDVNFAAWIAHYSGKDERGELGGSKFRSEFQMALRDVLGLNQGQHLPRRLYQMLDRREDQDLVAACRTALTIAALKSIGAGLVIFDEFQRFRDLMDDVEVDGDSDEDEIEAIRSRSSARVLESIRGLPNTDGPALLLLSATPYTPYRRHTKALGQDETDSAQSADFFDLISFLAASDKKATEAKAMFLELSEELRKGDFSSKRAQSIRMSLMGILLPLMSRTERPAHLNGKDAIVSATSVIDAELLISDMAQFREMQECFSPASRDWIVPLWQSVPLPMQTLGSRYLAWTNKVKMPARAALQRDRRDAFRLVAPWPHPRVRALMAKMSEKRLAMPWAAPSLPWWPLRGGWKAENDSKIDGKLLVFSRYKAVPTALSGLISYTTECNLLAPKQKRSRLSYEDASKRRLLQPNSERPALLELFHPCRLLAKLEPLSASLGNHSAMRREIERQLRHMLREMGVNVTPNLKGRRRKPWELMVALEKKAGLWESSRTAWETIAPVAEDADSVGRLGNLIQRWDEFADQANDFFEISAETEFQALVSLALESPGVVLLRALSRHWTGALEPHNMRLVLPVVWRGLRSYLDKSWFVAALGDRGGEKFPTAIRNAVIEGNLESVLDEHFWFLSTDGSGDWAVRLEEVEKSLRLRDANVTFHEGDEVMSDGAANSSPSFTIRCHVAVPLAEGRKNGSSSQVHLGEAYSVLGNSPLRPDEIRKAFNSPFWPNVLVTTSIGQEGLDLHPWCNSLAHWDLANSPVSLEQREGRITRFGSLSVRRAIANKLRSQIDPTAGSSPWHQLAVLADSQLSDDSGMSPWWVVEGGECSRYFLTVPGGEQQERFELLARERVLYRLVLGMPDQSDLIRLLDAQGKDPESLRNACIDLSAYSNQKRR